MVSRHQSTFAHSKASFDLQREQDEMSFEDYLIMKGEDIIEVEYYMLELVDLALRQRMEYLFLTIMQTP